MNAMCWADRTLKGLGDFNAFVSGDTIWRSTAIHDHASRMAAGLVAMGLAPGDRVLLWLPNSPELVIAWRAVLRAGGIAVIAHHDSPVQRIEQLAAQTQPSTIISSAGRFTQNTASNVCGPALRYRIHTGGDEECFGWTSMRRMVAEHIPLKEPVPRSDRDAAYIEFTSGTTGVPKGIVVRHGMLGRRLRAYRTRFAGWRRSLRYLCVLPMSGSFGNSPLLDGLARKCTHYFLDRFDPERALEMIERHRIERIQLVPAMCEAILAVPNVQRFDVSSLRSVVCSGAKVSNALIERFRTAFGISMEVQYGITGVGAVSRTSHDSKPGSVGRPSSRLRAKIVDGEGREVAIGEVGELMLRPRKNKPVKYWGHEGSAASADPPDVWYRTGDMAHFDADGELYILGRSDDLIVQGGHNIHGNTVAEIIQELPGVRECAVVGVASEYLGQDVAACVALREGVELTAADIVAHCRKHLESRAVPASVTFFSALPRNEAGKVRNSELREVVEAARHSVHETDLVRRLAAVSVAARFDLVRDEVRCILGRVLREAGAGYATSTASFQDMGLDSLGAVELSHTLSKVIGRPVPATLAYTYPDIDAVCAFLLEILGWPSVNPAAVAPSCPSPEALHLKAYFSPIELDAARGLPPAQNLSRGAQSVFLTGANGFVGRFLVLEILEKLPGDGRLYCLVRPSSDASGVEKLRRAYTSDPNLLEALDRQLASGRLIVLEGDLTQARFGLPGAVYDRLCGEVDGIVHNGAVVDHVMGYRELFAPNVLGTIEAMRFAVAQRIKPINYVSTIAARSLAQKASSPGNAGHAAGYAATKWASEKLLKELHDEIRIPVRIYRPSHIMAHTKAAGQINTQDTLTRLLQGIVLTSLAPRSFYAEGRATEGAHYNGLPVDTVARSIAALSVMGQSGRPEYAEYDIVNTHRDVSLDVITEWVTSAGYKIERIDDYEVWHSAFRSRLDSLSRTQRQQSLLPLLHTWEKPKDVRSPRRRPVYYPRQSAQDDAPRITEAFIHKCLKDMRMLGLVDRSK